MKFYLSFPIFRVGAVLIALVTFPALSMMFPGVTSFAPGLAVVALLSILFLSHIKDSAALEANARSFREVFWIFGILLSHALLAAWMTVSFNWPRFCGSLFLILLLYWGGRRFLYAIKALSSCELRRVLVLGMVFMLLVGGASLLGISWVDHAIFKKSVLFYREPGHYAVALLPLLNAVLLVERSARKWLLVGLTLFLGFATQSLTLLVGASVASVFSLRPPVVVLGLLGVILMIWAIDPSYYLDRLNFSSQTDHLSTLVYMAGWERAWIDVRMTQGVGVGFQQFGLVGDLGTFQSKIAELRPDLAALNLRDGSTTGSKLAGEFGALGLIVLISYLAFLVRVYFVLRFENRVRLLSAHDGFGLSCLLSAVTEFFVRGMGYMTPGMFLFIVGLLWLFQSGQSSIFGPVSGHSRY